MSLLLTMTLFGSIGTLFYILLQPLAKKYFPASWRRNYLIFNIMEYIFPFPYLNVKYKELFYNLAVHFRGNSAKVSLYADLTKDFIQVTMMRIYTSSMLMYIFVGGVIITSLWILVKRFRKYRNVKNYFTDDANELADNVYTDAMHKCFDNSKMARHIRIYRCSNVDTPLTIGIFRPAIVLPDVEFTESELEFVIEHEMTHIRQCDNLIKILSLVVLALNFYNPFAYYLLCQWNEVIEQVCDAKVLKGKSADKVKEYGNLVIRISTEADGSGKIPVIGFSLRGKDKKQTKIMKERICQMKKGPKKISLLRKLVGACVMGVVLFTSSLSVLAYSPKNVWFVDDIGDDIIISDKNVDMWGDVSEDLPIEEEGWVLLSEDGEIIEVIDESDIESETYSICNHYYKAYNLAKHTVYSDGGCKVEYYDSLRCEYCGKVVIGDWIKTNMFAVCPH